MERVVEAISRRGLYPTEDVQLHLAVACVRAKMWDKAAAIFEKLASFTRQDVPAFLDPLFFYP